MKPRPPVLPCLFWLASSACLLWLLASGCPSLSAPAPAPRRAPPPPPLVTFGELTSGDWLCSWQHAAIYRARFRADGVWELYSRHDRTSPCWVGTWKLEGNVLTVSEHTPSGELRYDWHVPLARDGRALRGVGRITFCCTNPSDSPLAFRLDRD